MKLRGRNLSAGIQGDDVRELHGELRRLGFAVSAGEVDAGTFGDTTAEAVRRFQRTNGLAETAVVDEQTAGWLGPRGDCDMGFLVHGRVVQGDGGGVPGLIVRAFDKDLRSEEPLGEATTDAVGAYEIRYTATKFSRAEKGSADLRVAACHPDGREVVSSPIRFNAKADETVDLHLSPEMRGPSEYERYLGILEPVLQGVSLADVREDERLQDVTFLAGDTGIEREHLVLLVRAAQEAQPPAVPGVVTGPILTRPISTIPTRGGLGRTDVGPARGPGPVAAPAFYGWFRQGLPTDRRSLLRNGTDVLIAALKRAIQENVVPVSLGAELDRIGAVLDEWRVQDQLEQAPQGTGASLGDGLRILPRDVLAPDQATVFARLHGENRLGEDLWQKSRDAGLSPPQVASLQSLFVINKVVGGEPGLLREAHSVASRLAGSSAPAAVAVAAMDQEDWLAALTAARPSGENPVRLAEEARELTRRVAQMLPSEFLTARASRLPAPKTLTRRLDDLARLQRVNGRDVLRRSFDELDLSSIPEAEREGARTAFQDLRRIANYYPGLQIHQVLEGDGSVDEKIAETTRRVSLVAKVAAQNPDTNFVALDYTPDSPDLEALRFEGIEERDKPLVLGTLKAFWRVHEVTGGDTLRTKEVLEAGFGAATRIAKETLQSFADATGMTESQAYPIYAAAQDRVTDSAIAFVGWHDLVQMHSDDRYTIGSVSPSLDITDYLRKLAGFEEMFGAQVRCRCHHCQSVVSSAAYFVDLMRFVDQNVTRKVFIGARSTHPLKLRTRREDLWKLALTCANTDTLIPTLEIVNELLEDFLARDLNPRPVGRAATQRDVYRRLAVAQDSFEQPFVLPLRRIEAYLGHFERTRSDVARILGVDADTGARARLGLSLAEHDLITRARDTDQAFLTRLFTTNVTFDLRPTTPVAMVRLLGLTRWTRDELGQLLGARFVKGAANISIVAWKEAAESVQNDAEAVTGLSLEVLDRLHRFRRLQRKLRWTVAETDLIVMALSAGAAPTLSAPVLTQIANLAGLRKRLAFPVDQLCALFSTIPTTGVDGQPPLFDRLFNLEPFVSQDGLWPTNQTFTHPSQAGGTARPDNKALQRLLAGLHLSDQELLDLIQGLSLAQPFALSAENLTRLYRHAHLARLLDLSIAELFQLIRIAGIGQQGDRRVRSLADVILLVDTFDRWRTSRLTLDDLSFLLGGTVLKPSTYPDAAFIANEIAAAVRAAHALEFDDTVFSQLPGISEAQSRQILAANPAMAERVAGSNSYRLNRAFNPVTGAIAAPIGVTLDVPRARTLLDQFHPRGILPGRIASQLRIPETKVRALSALIGNRLDAHDPDLVGELQAPSATPRLRALVESFLPLEVLQHGPAWDVVSIQFVRDNPALFSLTLPVAAGQISPDAAFKADAYARWTTLADEEFAPEQPQADAAAVRTVLRNGFGDDAAVARALRVPTAQVAALKPHLALNAAQPFAALTRLSSSLGFSAYLGVSGETLKLIVPTVANATDEYNALVQGAEGLYGVIRVKYPEERTFLEKIEPYEDQLRGLKRDGLVEYVIRSGAKGFTRPQDISDYFLIDTQVEGCARTSRIVAATSTLQLYVHRVLMNLEQDELGATDPRHAHVEPSRIPGEWEWRKHYRVWEANRKVFLYPENYIEPALRDDKTPLFRELEGTLLQQKISEQSVRDAYAEYLKGVDELAQLRIAGSYHDKDTVSERDTLHLFGVTPADPLIFYYRTIENLHYGGVATRLPRRLRYTPWRKVDVQIPVRRVSPIVFEGRLYILWLEVSTQPRNNIEFGSSVFRGYRHKMAVKYTLMRLDGTWSAPQLLSFRGSDLPDVLVEDMTINMPAIGGTLGPAAGTSGASGAPATGSGGTSRKVPVFDPLSRDHQEPIEGYSLKGFPWDRVYPNIASDGRLLLALRNFRLVGEVDPVTRVLSRAAPFGNTQPQPPTLVSSVSINGRVSFDVGYRDFSASSIPLTPYATASALVQSAGALIDDYPRQDTLTKALNPLVAQGAQESLVGFAFDDRSTIDIVNGSLSNAIIDTAGDNVLLQLVAPTPAYHLRRLGTSVVQKLNRALMTGGIDSLLDTTLQETLEENRPPVDILSASRVTDRTLNPKQQRRLPDGRVVNLQRAVDFTGPYGTYLREIFFHVPFLIANHQNSEQRFSAAQRWYHYIFDPTAFDVLPPAASASDRARLQRERVWRFTEFRGLTVPTLRKMLTDPGALEAYRTDPFNPDAIARLRPTAYQKAMVMKYIDNLLDWGDTLFAEFTMESVNEATMLYVTAADILGPPSPEVGACGEDAATTYEAIEARPDSEFLIELEHFAPSKAGAKMQGKTSTWQEIGSTTRMTRSFAMIAGGQPDPPGGGELFQAGAMNPTSTSFWRTTGGVDLHKLGPYGSGRTLEEATRTTDPGQVDGPRITLSPDPINPPDVGVLGKGGNIPMPGGFVRHDYTLPEKYLRESLGPPTGRPPETGHGKFGPIELGGDMSRIVPVFCVPPNPDLRAYWDRVANRLYKVRNCMDITGARRQLSLFAPEIDPRLLVRARAAGLSLDDVLNVTSGSLPPYRFTFLIERAKQAASTVQSFGSMLLSALEKKDAEELARLRTVHEQNVLKLRARVFELEIDAAGDTLLGLQRQRDGAEYRRQHFGDLLQTGLMPWERTQQALQHSANALTTLAAILSGAGGILALVPQLGAPTAMVYGGIQVSKSAEFWAAVSRDTAALLRLAASSAGLEAVNQRREQEWRHLQRVAETELKTLAGQIGAAKTRIDIARRSQEIHQKTVAQAEEVFALYREKFSSFDLYRVLSTSLHRLHREAFNAAFALARLAEQAYRFERPDDPPALLEELRWDASRAGLLAGERLLLDLHNLERRFLETNYRTLEIEQSFSLQQFDPSALLKLQRDGQCTFAVPEIFFDLTYPGHYRRQIKAVRLTIPCVTGSYVNVGATLRLQSSFVRGTPSLAAPLLVVPLRHTTSVAASTAQNDAGVFEFSFRDERYMPFEGAGAISDWSLSLPRNFQPFDYRTISDIILRVAYTAQEDGNLRTSVEQLNATVQGTISQRLSSTGIDRVFSLRHEFPDAWLKLMRAPVNTFVDVVLTERHLPFFISDKGLAAASATVLLNTKTANLGAFGLELGAIGLTSFTADQRSGLRGASAGSVTVIATHRLRVTNAGALAPGAGGTSTLDDTKLDDILLRFTLKTTPPVVVP